MDWKNALNKLKSEIPQAVETPEVDNTTLDQKRQAEPLRVELDKRNGKPATLISDFQGTDSELKNLTKLLKVKCGAGGSFRDGEILIQGDFRLKITAILMEMGFKVKKINFK